MQQKQNYPRYRLKKYWIVALSWLVVINLIAFLWHLGSTSLVDETEPLFAEAARQMTVTNDWITPYFNGVTRFDKPPLIYWLMAIAYKLIGVNEWAVRLPSALSAIALTMMGFITLQRFGILSDRRDPAQNNQQKPSQQKQTQLSLAAFIGSGLMALNPHTIIWGRTGVSDMLLSGCMGCALFCFFWGYATTEENQVVSGNSWLGMPNKWYLAFYVLLGLAVLTKGPVGIVLPGLIIGSFLLFTGRFWQVVAELKLVVGALIFAVITIPWFILVWLRNGQAYFDSFFGYHNFERFTDVVNGHAAPWYFYFLIVLGLFAPWSVYLPVAIAKTQWWRRNYWRKQLRSNQLGIFAFCWFISIFAFFSVSVTKLPSYVLPLVPAASILIAMLWSRFIVDSKPKSDRSLLVSILFNLVLAIALAIAFYISPSLVGKDPATPKLSRLVADSSLPISGTLVWGLLACAIAFLATKVKYWRWIIVANLIGFMAFVSFVLLPTVFFIDTHRQLPLKELAQTINQVQQESEPIVMVGFMKPSLVFYTQKPVLFFKNREKFTTYAKENGDLSKSGKTLLVGRPKDIKKVLDLEIEDYQPIDERGVYTLTRIKLSE